MLESSLNISSEFGYLLVFVGSADFALQDPLSAHVKATDTWEVLDYSELARLDHILVLLDLQFRLDDLVSEVVEFLWDVLILDFSLPDDSSGLHNDLLAFLVELEVTHVY